MQDINDNLILPIINSFILQLRNLMDKLYPDDTVTEEDIVKLTLCKVINNDKLFLPVGSILPLR